jgi:hypothetical protein
MHQTLSGRRRSLVRQALLVVALLFASIVAALPARAADIADEADANGIHVHADGQAHDHSAMAATGEESRGGGLFDYCEAYRLERSAGGYCTHGDDAPAPGFSRDAPVAPLSTAEINVQTVCDGDGVSGNRTQVMYVRASDKPDRYAQFAASIRQWASDADAIYSASAQETGGDRHIRFVHDASCQPVVLNIVLNSAGDDNFDNTINQLANMGHDRSDRKYMIFMDASVYCGIGTLYGDDSHGSTNANNSGPSYGRSDNGCWNGETAAHEHMHNIGGVQLTAPHTSGGWHCVDEYDVMCYSDGPYFPPMQYICQPSTLESRFDCNDDDYYNTNPQAGSYLATHWNAANSAYLIAGGAPPPVCADEELEPDNAVEQAKPIALGTTQARAFCVVNDFDWVSITAVAGTTYVVETLNLATGTDTWLDLVAPDGTTILQSNDNGGGGKAARIVFVAQSSGTYYAVASQTDHTGDPLLTYSLKVTGGACPDVSLEPDNTQAQARTVAVGLAETRAFCSAGDQDWTRFTPATSASLTVETLNLAPGTDTVIELFLAGSSRRMAYNDNRAAGDPSSAITFTAIAGNTYVVKATQQNGAGGTGLVYTLKVAAGNTGDPTGPVTSVTTSPPANAAGWHNGDVGVTISATDADGVQSVTYSATGAQVIGSTTVSGGSASFNVTAEGETTISYTAKDNSNNTAQVKTLVVRIDRTAPVVSGAPTPRLNALGVVEVGGYPVTLDYASSDALSGVGGSALEMSVNGGPFSAVTEGTSVVRQVTPGSTYQFRLSVSDVAGNTSQPAAGPVFAAGYVQENNPGIVYTGPWVTESPVHALGGSLKSVTGAGRVVQYQFTGTNLGWVATRTSTSGIARVFIDGNLAGEVNLKASSTQPRRIVFSVDGLTDGAHTVRIETLGTTGMRGGSRFEVDAFVVIDAQ